MKSIPLFLIIFMCIGLFMFATPVMAVETDSFSEDNAAESGLSTSSDAGAIINDVIAYITAILAGLFVLMMLIGSIMYMVYSDTEKKQKGMTLIQSAIIAAIIALLSYAVWAILENVLGVGGNTDFLPGIR